MTVHDWSPEEFARLAALPEESPERLALAADPRFQARLLLLREFESAREVPPGAAEASSAAAELTRRLARAAAPTPRVVPRARLGPPLASWALAAAAFAIVAGGIWWLRAPLGPASVTRGIETSTTLDWVTVHGSGGRLELSWNSVSGAERYRVVFYDASQRVIARVDSLAVTRLVLERGALPAGLPAGASVMAEVSALRGGDVVATARARAIRVP